MLHLAVVVAANILGIDVGWQPLPDGGVEYIIQIPPQTFDVLKPNEAVQSRVPDEVKDIRQCRVVIGRGPLPRQLPPQTAVQSAKPFFPQALGKTSLRQSESASPPDGNGDGKTSGSSDQAEEAQGAASWWAAIGALVALFASLGVNVYLGWLTWELHRRCQTAAPSKGDPAEQPGE